MTSDYSSPSASTHAGRDHFGSDLVVFWGCTADEVVLSASVLNEIYADDAKEFSKRVVFEIWRARFPDEFSCYYEDEDPRELRCGITDSTITDAANALAEWSLLWPDDTELAIQMDDPPTTSSWWNVVRDVTSRDMHGEGLGAENRMTASEDDENQQNSDGSAVSHAGATFEKSDESREAEKAESSESGSVWKHLPPIRIFLRIEKSDGCAGTGMKQVKDVYPDYPPMLRRRVRIAIESCGQRQGHRNRPRLDDDSFVRTDAWCWETNSPLCWVLLWRAFPASFPLDTNDYNVVRVFREPVDNSYAQYSLELWRNRLQLMLLEAARQQYEPFMKMVAELRNDTRDGVLFCPDCFGKWCHLSIRRHYGRGGMLLQEVLFDAIKDEKACFCKKCQGRWVGMLKTILNHCTTTRFDICSTRATSEGFHLLGELLTSIVQYPLSIGMVTERHRRDVITQLLLDAGADPNVRTSCYFGGGVSPLEHLYGSTDWPWNCAKILLDGGACAARILGRGIQITYLPWGASPGDGRVYHDELAQGRRDQILAYFERVGVAKPQSCGCKRCQPGSTPQSRQTQITKKSENLDGNSAD